MRGSLIAVAALCLLFGGVSAIAQVQPIPQDQLENGFLGEQNSRLSNQDAPSGAHYSTRATAAIAQGDYARALAILRPYRLTRSATYFYLAGRAHVGLGDYSAARRELTQAIRQDASLIHAKFTLGMMEAEHGDRAAAERILADLRVRQTRCAKRCRELSNLDAMVWTIEAALKGRGE